jgi:hypothetical protein
MVKTANSGAEREPATGEHGPRWPDVARSAGSSARNYLRQVYAGSIHLRRDRLGVLFHIGEHGDYAIFRETTGDDGVAGEPCVLVVGFRLRALGAIPALHWLFQRVCLLTTPFWSGFPGFRVKLWMVNPATEDYLGIYRWAGADHAATYVTALAKVLRALSTPDSVWYDIYPATDFESFLAARAVTPSPERAANRMGSPA